MKLFELVQELRENLLRDASTLKTGSPDHYWSDETLVKYINEGQRRFARRTFCLADDVTPEVVQIALKPTVAIYQAHPSILHVVSARHQDALADLVYVSHPIVFSTVNPFTDTHDNWGTYSANQGQLPLRYTTDEGLQVDDQHQIRICFNPTPGVTQVGKKVNLRVRRLPMNPFVSGKMNQASEIPEDWQLDTLEWAAYRCLRNWDLDAEDRKKAKDHKDRFDEAVRECVHELRLHQMFQPPVWAFGQGGFSYIHN